MQTYLFLVLLFVAAVAWIFANPLETTNFIYNLRVKWHKYLVKKEGTKAAEVIFERFIEHSQKENLDPEVTQEIINEEWDYIVELLGEREVDRIYRKYTEKNNE